MGDAVRTGKIQAGTFVEPFLLGRDFQRRPAQDLHAVEAVGYDHELLDIWFGDRFLRANRTRCALSSPTTSPSRSTTSPIPPGQRDLHKSGFVRTPLDIYLKNADWKRDPDAPRRRPSLEKLSRFMLEKLQWLEKPVNVPR